MSALLMRGRSWRFELRRGPKLRPRSGIVPAMRASRALLFPLLTASIFFACKGEEGAKPDAAAQPDGPAAADADADAPAADKTQAPAPGADAGAAGAGNVGALVLPTRVDL